jgi:uncharacterized membrane protein YdfJ with MMPL/SSD domain
MKKLKVSLEQLMDMSSQAASVSVASETLQLMEDTLNTGGSIELQNVSGVTEKVLNTIEEFNDWKYELFGE